MRKQKCKGCKKKFEIDDLEEGICAECQSKICDGCNARLDDDGSCEWCGTFFCTRCEEVQDELDRVVICSDFKCDQVYCRYCATKDNREYDMCNVHVDEAKAEEEAERLAEEKAAAEYEVSAREWKSFLATIGIHQEIEPTPESRPTHADLAAAGQLNLINIHALS